MKQKTAERIIIGMSCISVGLAILHTFFDQDYIGALVGISATSMFYYLHRNPEMMMTKSLSEFDELYDNSRDKKFLWGFPAYYLVVLSAILYIWLV